MNGRSSRDHAHHLDAGFAKKLAGLNSTQLSIETLSKWMIFNYKHAKILVITWEREVRKAHPERKLTFCYLANDVLQNSRKKGKDFVHEFAKYLPAVFYDMYRTCQDSPKNLEGALRLSTIWEERRVFDSNITIKLRRALDGEAFRSDNDRRHHRPRSDPEDESGEARSHRRSPDDAPASDPPSAASARGSNGAEGAVGLGLAAAYRSPLLSGPASKLGDALVAVAETGRDSEGVGAQRACLRPLLFSTPPPPASQVEAAEVSGALQLVVAEKTALDAYKKELTGSMQLLRDLLKEQVGLYQDNENRLKENEGRLKALTALQFRSQSGLAPPPPAEDSPDDEDLGDGADERLRQLTQGDEKDYIP